MKKARKSFFGDKDKRGERERESESDKSVIFIGEQIFKRKFREEEN
jgi:hypothetical protein